MRSIARSASLAVLIVFVFACGDGGRGVDSARPRESTALPSALASSSAIPSDGGPSASAAPLASASAVVLAASPALDDACHDYAAKVCHEEETCGGSLLEMRHADLASCKSIEARSCAELLAPPKSSATVEGIAKCGDARAASCEALLGDPPVECRTGGTVQDGAPCAQNAQCTGGFCDRDSDKRCGTCRHLAELHEPCTRGSVCAWGLVCDGGVCQKRAGVGEACRGFVACASSLQCVKGECAASATEGQKCDPTAHAGADCNASAGLVCAATSKTCVQAKVAKLGEHCSKDVVCVGGTHCGASKKCEKAARIGDPCSPSGPFCDAPLLCIAGVCGALDPKGCN